MEQRSVTNSGNRKWLCVAKVGETPGDEAANTGWSQLRKNVPGEGDLYREAKDTLFVTNQLPFLGNTTRMFQRSGNFRFRLMLLSQISPVFLSTLALSKIYYR